LCLLLATYIPEMCIRPVTCSRQILFHAQRMHTNIGQADSRRLLHKEYPGLMLNFWMRSVGTLQSSAHLQDVLTSAQTTIHENLN
jgi:hypothetical protein